MSAITTGAPGFTGLHHLTIPVADLADIPWYESVLGAERVGRFDHHGPDGELTAVVLHAPGIPLVELRVQPEIAARVAGYAPVAFGIGARDDLDRWSKRLDSLRVEHTEITERKIGHSLDIRCPVTHLVLRLYTDPVGGFDNVEFKQ